MSMTKGGTSRNMQGEKGGLNSILICGFPQTASLSRNFTECKEGGGKTAEA